MVVQSTKVQLGYYTVGCFGNESVLVKRKTFIECAITTNTRIKSGH